MKQKVKRMAVGGLTKDIGTGSMPRPFNPNMPATGPRPVKPQAGPRPVKPGGVPVRDIGTGTGSPRPSMFKKGGAVKKKTTTRARKK